MRKSHSVGALFAVLILTGLPANRFAEQAPFPGAGLSSELKEGAAAFREEKWGVATEHFKNALRYDPKNTSALFNLGSALIRQEKYADAEPVLLRALALQPNAVDVIMALATIEFRNGQDRNAFDLFKRATELAPESALPHFMLGQVAAAIGNPSAKEREYQIAASLDPQFSPDRLPPDAF
jgi:Flp pilus assembly protein TadD